jgi:hypothetical protein
MNVKTHERMVKTSMYVKATGTWCGTCACKGRGVTAGLGEVIVSMSHWDLAAVQLPARVACE